MYFNTVKETIEYGVLIGITQEMDSEFRNNPPETIKPLDLYLEYNDQILEALLCHYNGNPAGFTLYILENDKEKFSVEWSWSGVRDRIMENRGSELLSVEVVPMELVIVPDNNKKCPSLLTLQELKAYRDWSKIEI